MESRRRSLLSSICFQLCVIVGNSIVSSVDCRKCDKCSRFLPLKAMIAPLVTSVDLLFVCCCLHICGCTSKRIHSFCFLSLCVRACLYKQFFPFTTSSSLQRNSTIHRTHSEAAKTKPNRIWGKFLFCFVVCFCFCFPNRTRFNE